MMTPPINGHIFLTCQKVISPYILYRNTQLRRHLKTIFRRSRMVLNVFNYQQSILSKISGPPDVSRQIKTTVYGTSTYKVDMTL